MRPFLAIIFFAALLPACNNSGTEASLLNQPPYQAITDSIKRFPGRPELWYRRGTILYRQEQNDLALQDIRMAYQLLPSEEYALSITTILKQKSPDSAVAFLQKAVQELPHSIALQVGLARGYQAKGQAEKALAVTDAIIERYPGQLDALALKSELLGSQNKSSESLAYLEKAHALVPSDPALTLDLAYAYAEAGDPRALKLTDSLITGRAPEVEKAFFIRGVYFSEKGHQSEALQQYDRAIQANYNFLDAYQGKGELLYNQKKFAEAQKVFGTALRIAPAEATFYFWLGKTQQALGNKAEARANYLRAYGLNKSLTEARQAAEALEESH